MPKFIITFLLTFGFLSKLQAQSYSWEESSTYFRPSIGVVFIGGSYDFEGSLGEKQFSPTGFNFFPSSLGFAVGRKIISDLSVELDFTYFSNQDYDNQTQEHKESHVVFALGPVYYFDFDGSPVVPHIGLNVGAVYSQITSTEVYEDPIYGEDMSVVSNLGAGVDVGLFDHIDVGLKYKLLFIAPQNDMSVDDAINQFSIGHRFHHILELGAKINADIL